MIGRITDNTVEIGGDTTGLLSISEVAKRLGISEEMVKEQMK